MRKDSRESINRASSANDPSKKEDRISLLKDKVNLAQKKLQIVDKEGTARRLITVLEGIESPTKGSLDFTALRTQTASLNNSMYLPQNQSFDNSRHTQFQNASMLIEGDPFNASATGRENGAYQTNRMKKMKEILTKIEKFKLSSPNATKLLGYIQNRIEANRSLYYNFLPETDPLTLKVIIQILYEEVENLSNQYEYQQMNAKNQFDEMTKKLDDKQLLCNRLTDDVVEQNIIIQRLKQLLEGMDLNFARTGSFFLDCKGYLQNLLYDLKRPDFFTYFDSYARDINKKGNTLLDQISKLEQDLKGRESFQTGGLNFLVNKGDFTQEFGNFGNNNPSTIRGERNYMQYCQELLGQISTLEAENRRLNSLVAEKDRITIENERIKAELKNANDEIKKLKTANEKQLAENDKLKDQISQIRAEYSNLSSQVLRSQSEKDGHTRAILEENDHLRRQLRDITESVHLLEKQHNEHADGLEDELKKARERLVVVLEKKKAQEKEIFQLTLERNELKSHLDKLQDEMENIQLEETQRRGNGPAKNSAARKNSPTSNANEPSQEEEIRELKARLEDKQEKLKRNEERLRQLEIKLEESQANTPKAGGERTPKETANIENTVHLFKKELEKINHEKEESQNRCAELEQANKELEEKLQGDPEVFARVRESYAMEQLAAIILSKAKNMKNIDEETKQNIQRFLGENFSHLVDPLYLKIRDLEGRNKALKQKLQDRIWKDIAKLEDVKWFGNNFMNSHELLARNNNSQLPSTVIMLKEDLEKKKPTVVSKIVEANNEIQNNKNELKKLTEEEEVNGGQYFSFAERPNSEGSKQYVSDAGLKTELLRMRDENEELKNKLQTQALEMGSLKSQLSAYSHGGDEGQRRNSRDIYQRSRSVNPGKSPRANRVAGDDDEAEVQQVAKKIALDLNDHEDMLLMLHMQASSIEALLNSTY